MYLCMCLHCTYMHVIRLTHMMHYYVHILHMSISLHPPSFDVKAHLQPCVVCLWLFHKYSILSSNIDFHHGPNHLWLSHHSLSYGSFAVSGPWSKLLHTPQLSGCLLLDLDHLAASTDYYSSGGSKCLEVHVPICRGGRLHTKWCPCYHILFFFIVYFLTLQPHILFLNHNLRIRLPSIDITNIPMVMWVSSTTVLPWCPVSGTCGLPTQTWLQLFLAWHQAHSIKHSHSLIPSDYLLGGKWCYPPLHYPSVVLCWEFCHCYCQHYAH